VPEIWDAVDGSVVKPAIYSTEGEQLRIPVSFEPLQSLIFIIRGDKAEKHITKVHSGSKQIFPQLEKTDAQIAIPTATLVDNDFEFVSQQTKDYNFTDSNGEVFRTQLEEPSVYAINDFKGTMDFEPIYDETIEPIKISSLKSLTEFDSPAIKYFAGNVKYTIQFSAPKSMLKNKGELFLNLGNFDAVAEVHLNGKHLRTNWIPGAKIPVTKFLEKQNTLEITVATVCCNRFIGDYIEHGEVKTLFTTTMVDKYFNKDKPLKPSGLMGPIQLIQNN
jgi:hypothetical protein